MLLATMLLVAIASIIILALNGAWLIMYGMLMGIVIGVLLMLGFVMETSC